MSAHPHEGFTRVFVLLFLIGAIGVLTERPRAETVRRAPVVGRSEFERRLGLGPWSRLRTEPVEQERTRRLVERLLEAGFELPPDAERVVVHPYVGQLPPTDLEEGPPWHLIFGGSTFEVTERGRRGRPGVPPGTRPGGKRAATLRSVHVAVPFAGRLDEAGQAMLRGLRDAVEMMIRRKGGGDG